MLTRRTRFLALRLTEAEYQRLRDACTSAGCRNLSEFTRSGLLGLMSDEGPATFDRRLCELEKRMDDLQALFQRLCNAERAEAQTSASA